MVHLMMAGTAQGRLQNSETAQPRASAATLGQAPQPLSASKLHLNLHDGSASFHDASPQNSMPAESPDLSAKDVANGGLVSPQLSNQHTHDGEPDERRAKGHAGLAARAGPTGHAAGQAAAEYEPTSQAIETENSHDNGGESTTALEDDLEPDRMQARYQAGTPDAASSGQSKAQESRSAGPHDRSNDPDGHEQNDLWPYHRTSTEPATLQDEAPPVWSLQQADSTLEVFTRATGRRTCTQPHCSLVAALCISKQMPQIETTRFSPQLVLSIHVHT